MWKCGRNGHVGKTECEKCGMWKNVGKMQKKSGLKLITKQKLCKKENNWKRKIYKQHIDENQTTYTVTGNKGKYV